MKSISIFGSTGSIGCNTLEVVRSLNRHGYPVAVKYLSGNSRTEIMIQQIREFKPDAAVVFSPEGYTELKGISFPNKCEILFGEDGLKEIISRRDTDLAVNALVGFSGLVPTIECIKNGVDVALANKESLVVAGEFITQLLKQSKSKLIPVDSEHSAILQCIQGESLKEVSGIILTASGGPFRDTDAEQLQYVTKEEALKHPNWKMGNKITIDSATLMNKGLEVIEAKWLFTLDTDEIKVLIHPQSIIHSLVEFSDGSYKAQLGVPDMKIPIQYAITFPERIRSEYERPDFVSLRNLTFEVPDFGKFPCLKMAYEAAEAGASYPVVLNASNEVAVELFLDGKIKFTDIAELIRNTLDHHESCNLTDLDSVKEIDKWARNFVYDYASVLH
ncbi:MAG: 1-deoxy-D-xylulose-5-phosphate reductoisomerase [Ignavibacteria bacterium]|nr:1-deoxy-D-xylulose-5-phosphate reductoisomerase [Ignavibacteria bacterium]